MTYRYRTIYRPAGGGSLPPGLSWRFVEAPHDGFWGKVVDMPVSRYRYGVVEVDRELTAEELATFQIEAVP